jgi:single-strand DNA-binding protein
MESITLIGNLGKDAQVHDSKSGKKFLSFTIAVNKWRNGEQKTNWYSISWFDFPQNMVQYLTKGKSVIIIGDLECDIRIDNTGTAKIDRSVFANTVQFVNTGTNEGNNSSNKPNTTKKDENEEVVVTNQTTTNSQPVTSQDDDDLPF